MGDIPAAWLNRRPDGHVTHRLQGHVTQELAPVDG
jgi:hypothetical protein